METPSNQTPTQKPKNDRLNTLLYVIYVVVAIVLVAFSQGHNDILLTLAAVFAAVAAINAFARRSWFQFAVVAFAVIGLILVITGVWKV